jgi:hypothetical protein
LGTVADLGANEQPGKANRTKASVRYRFSSQP